ncbi:MAG: flagellar protein FlgN [Gammaproteobacteria bacterium]|nr:flagellar protein FlgN [Gammaproteobacteria bacterium]
MNRQAVKLDTTAELEEILNKLQDMLLLERNSLMSSDSDEVNLISSEKNALLGVMARMSPELLKRVHEDTENDPEVGAIQRIRDKIATCRSYNKENALLVAQKLKVCRNSINLLTGGVFDAVVERYDQQGQTHSGVEKRYHGSV